MILELYIESPSVTILYDGNNLKLGWPGPTLEWYWVFISCFTFHISWVSTMGTEICYYL